MTVAAKVHHVRATCNALAAYLPSLYDDTNLLPANNATVGAKSMELEPPCNLDVLDARITVEHNVIAAAWLVGRPATPAGHPVAPVTVLTDMLEYVADEAARLDWHRLHEVQHYLDSAYMAADLAIDRNDTPVTTKLADGRQVLYTHASVAHAPKQAGAIINSGH